MEIKLEGFWINKYPFKRKIWESKKKKAEQFAKLKNISIQNILIGMENWTKGIFFVFEGEKEMQDFLEELHKNQQGILYKRYGNLKFA